MYLSSTDADIQVVATVPLPRSAASTTLFRSIAKDNAVRKCTSSKGALVVFIVRKSTSVDGKVATCVFAVLIEESWENSGVSISCPWPLRSWMSRVLGSPTVLNVMLFRCPLVPHQLGFGTSFTPTPWVTESSIHGPEPIGFA